MRFLYYYYINSPSATNPSIDKIFLNKLEFFYQLIWSIFSCCLTMSRVDLKTNESELLKARNSILNDETTKKYVIFGKFNIICTPIK